MMCKAILTHCLQKDKKVQQTLYQHAKAYKFFMNKYFFPQLSHLLFCIDQFTFPLPPHAKISQIRTSHINVTIQSQNRTSHMIIPIQSCFSSCHLIFPPCTQFTRTFSVETCSHEKNQSRASNFLRKLSKSNCICISTR